MDWIFLDIKNSNLVKLVKLLKLVKKLVLTNYLKKKKNVIGLEPIL